LMDELGLEPGPRIGALLRHLLDVVMDEPARNRREELLAIARDALSDDRPMRPATEARDTPG
ncbi:MAG: hypothetical protein M3295_06485, partial [Chloroflexota bacterium]|nr:hypothetical protein [Chloroflexota bacterium]